MAIEVLKRAVPSYFAVDLPSLPRSYWEALFPKPYWIDLRKFSSSNGLDPYLVAALIRQESEFNPSAVSRANAVGLMQLLPKVGKSVAKQEKLKHFSTTQLFTPGVNLQLGTRYFRGMVDKFGALSMRWRPTMRARIVCRTGRVKANIAIRRNLWNPFLSRRRVSMCRRFCEMRMCTGSCMGRVVNELILR